MAKSKTSDTYAFSVRLTREVEQALKTKQAKRVVDGLPHLTIPKLAAELIAAAVLV